MVSHLNLVEAILSNKQLDLRRKIGSNPQIQSNGPSFEAVLTKTLQKSPSVLPLSYESTEADMKFRDGLKFVLEREGSKHVRKTGTRIIEVWNTAVNRKRAWLPRKCKGPNKD